jgi:hypothetical protein
MYGPICEGRQWWKRYSRGLEELYDEPDTVKVKKIQ